MTFTSNPTYLIPTGFVAVGEERKLKLIFAVRNSQATNRSDIITLIVKKKNNGAATVTATLKGTTLTAVITEDDPDRGQSSNIQYQWQGSDSPDQWHDLVGATTATYRILQGTTATHYRVKMKYIDGQGYCHELPERDFGCSDKQTELIIYSDSVTDIDRDDDGLIDISTLEQLDAIRYNLLGTSYQQSKDAIGITSGCPVVAGQERCSGYELTRDLDFTADNSYGTPANKIKWTTGAGWEPIGDRRNSFRATFKGNGHTISNLMINRSGRSYTGLFGMTNNNATIEGVHLHKVNIIGKSDVGALVGANTGGSTITNNSISGDSNTTPTRVVGNSRVGGLVGKNTGGSTIDNVDLYGVHIKGISEVGGLAGKNDGSTIKNSRISRRYLTSLGGTI